MARILLASDLHYPTDGSLAWTLAEVLRHVDADALVLGGDFVDYGNENNIDKLLTIIRRTYKGPILAVWGNHEHYLSQIRIRKGWTSLDQLERLRQALTRYGASTLDTDGPMNVNGISLVGVVGWYDYSFGPPQYLEEDYDRCNPFGYSIETLRHCAKDPQYLGCPPSWWNDCLYVKLPMHHKDYARLNAEKLENQLRTAEPPVIVVLHHVPRKDLIKYTGNPQEDFDYAYAGSPTLKEVINHHSDKVAVITYGHLHNESVNRVVMTDGIPYINTYPKYDRNPGFTLITIEKERTNITMIQH